MSDTRWPMALPLGQLQYKCVIFPNSNRVSIPKNGKKINLIYTELNNAPYFFALSINFVLVIHDFCIRIHFGATDKVFKLSQRKNRTKSHAHRERKKAPSEVLEYQALALNIK